jgi:carbon monoxide dehydrogenase subunit G
MKLSGEATLRAGVDEVYAALIDPAILVRTIPGCRRLEHVGADSYKATVEAGVASIKGSFDGDVRLTDQRAPEAFTLHASGAGAPGTVSAVARVSLAPVDGGGTLLRYDADATIGGVIGGVGQRMITGVARKTATEFFAAVDRELAGVPTPEPVAAAPAAAREELVLATAATGGTGGVWTAPVPARDPARQRVRDLMIGAAFGAIVALLGVLVGALVAGW